VSLWGGGAPQEAKRGFQHFQDFTVTPDEERVDKSLYEEKKEKGAVVVRRRYAEQTTLEYLCEGGSAGQESAERRREVKTQ